MYVCPYFRFQFLIFAISRTSYIGTYFILISKQWKSSLHNTQAYNSFSDVGSDHRLLTATIQLSLRMSKIPVKRRYMIWAHWEIRIHENYSRLQSETDIENLMKI